MANRIFTEEEKAALAEEWRRSGMSQPQFCRAHGIGSPRTLRQWMQRWPGREVSEGRVRAMLEKILAALSALLHSLDAEEACLPAAADEPIPTGELSGADDDIVDLPASAPSSVPVEAPD